MSSTGVRGPQPKSARTQQRVLDAARRLFNERGTAPVSTNHIAAAAGVSPGNLYYHFRDKREIIRALHAEYAAAHDARWVSSADPGENLARLAGNLVVGMELAWEYRFFEREILALLRADAELQAEYRAVYERRLDEWTAFGEHLVSQGLLRSPRPPRTVRDLAVAIWLLAQSWVPFLELAGDPTDPQQFAHGTELILVALDPYLTAKGRRGLTRAAPLGAAATEQVG